MEQPLTIQRVADETGLSADTLRYYERIGLLAGIARSDSGHRRFSETDVGWIRFVQRLRATGMPIETIHRYAELLRAGDHTSDQRRQLLEAHRRQVKRELRQLQEALGIIERKIAGYEAVARGEDASCPTEPPPARRVHIRAAG